jgi:hypothetical protein
MTAAIHTEHLCHAFTLERDVEPVVVLEDISINLPTGSRTILVSSPLRPTNLTSSEQTVQVINPIPFLSRTKSQEESLHYSVS